VSQFSSEFIGRDIQKGVEGNSTVQLIFSTFAIHNLKIYSTNLLQIGIRGEENLSEGSGKNGAGYFQKTL